MRGISSLSVAITAIWSTPAFHVLATDQLVGRDTAVTFNPYADHENIGSLLGLRAEAITTLSEREAAMVNTAVKMSSMSDEELMEGTDAPYTYHQEFHPCPISCRDQVPQNWTVYTDFERLKLCNQSMLFDFNIYTPIMDPEAPTKMRVCNAGDRAASKPGLPVLDTTPTTNFTRRTIDPRALPSSAACAAPKAASETKALFHVSTQGPRADNQEDVVEALTQLALFFSTAECESTLMFSGAGSVVAGVHIGPGIRREAVSQLVNAMLDSIQTDGAAETTFSQLCSFSRPRTNTLGVAFSTTGNIIGVQNAVKTWNEAGCVGGFDSASREPTITTTISESPFEQFSANGTVTNGTLFSNTTVSSHRLSARGLCRTRVVEANDGCATLATKCGITLANFNKYNPDSELCTVPGVLQPGMLVCCSAGGMDDLKPKMGADGICATYHVQPGDNCAGIAGRYGLKVKDIQSFNQLKTWGWTTCDQLKADSNICLSEGKRPMPYPNPAALCGPTKPTTGNVKYVDDDEELTNMNPCPLNACCNVHGQCGISKDFCVRRPNPFGGPGTSLLKNGCVSSCGNAIEKSDSPPAEYGRVGYFETWNFDRPCLHMRVANANPGGRYTHIHWAFAGINTADWTVSINDTFKQWDKFKRMDIKKIISFGGWGYSTEPATYDILRQAMSPVNRDKFAANVAKFLDDEGLNGVDFDWEYPGAIDIPGTPPGKPEDGVNYLRFLTTMKAKIPKGKTLSIAAPASYWYLKAFPIEKISAVLDYIVYMTYDLHGQWDAGNPYSIDGCPAGNCIRSHVNLTETKNVLSMITKAKVPSNKIFVGESSYGRSFKLAEEGCRDGSCTFLGDRLNSWAEPGQCTQTSGYISNAEIEYIIVENDSAESWWDEDSDSDILVYDATEWVAYMTETTKDRRRNEWKGLNFAGTIDWAVDLQHFSDDMLGWDDSNDEDYEEEFPPPFPPCDKKTYNSLEDIEKDIANVPWWCKDQYMLQVLRDMQAKALTDYDKLVADGYDNKFDRYAEAILRSGQANIDRFMHDSGNSYFECTITEAYTCKDACYYMNTVDEDTICRYSEDWDCGFDSGCWSNPECNSQGIETRYKNITGPCSPDFSKRSAPREPATGFNEAVFWKFREGKEEDFWADLQIDTGIKKEDTRMAESHKFGGDCILPPTDKKNCKHMGHHYNYPEVTNGYTLEDITNPKDIIEEAHGGMQALKPQLDDVLGSTDSGYGSVDSFVMDIVDSVAMPVHMTVDAVKSMGEISKTVDKWDEEKRKSIILAFLTALFLFIPFAGQAAGAFMASTMIIRIAASIGVAGDIALGIYSAVEDDDNLPLAIIGIVLAPLSLLDAGKMAKAANFRRTMGRDGPQALGKGVSNGMETIGRIRGDKCLLSSGGKKKRSVWEELAEWDMGSASGNATFTGGL